MSTVYKKIFLTLLLLISVLEAKPADLTRHDVKPKMEEIFKAHVKYKQFTPMLAERTLHNFIEHLDYTKTYFLQSEVARWQQMKEEDLKKIVSDFERSKFPVFEEIIREARQAIQRRDRLEEKLKKDPKKVEGTITAKEFKDLDFCTSEEALYERLQKIRSMQRAVAEKLTKDTPEISIDQTLERIDKRRKKQQEEIVNTDPKFAEQVLSTLIVKSIASSLDPNTNYLTPQEASQFLVSMQQRLLGIGIQLRDDLDGFSIIRVIEGGPADRSKQIQAKDKIIAVDGEPIIGLDIWEVVDVLRGQEGTPVDLRIVRTSQDKKEEVKDITVTRGEVVFQEARIESKTEPFQDGVIAHIRLHSFYQDADTSSADDVQKALQDIQKKNKILGVILDLRMNTGGLLVQAIEVSGLFMKKGIVVSVKDETGSVYHLRNLTREKIWDGPLAILVNRASASASEIVTKTLQEYGRAIVIGDDHSYGKGTFQTFTLAATSQSSVDPQGEYKVTRGCYYTVSGKSPQLVGVSSDIMVKSGLEAIEFGEQFSKYPLPSDSIDPCFQDDFQDIPFFHRENYRKMYGSDVQKIETTHRKFLDKLKTNSEKRLSENKPYQKFLADMNAKDFDIEDMDTFEKSTDFQLLEAFDVMKDLVSLEHTEVQPEKPAV
jgi:carboxyl-terminal processing protease